MTLIKNGDNTLKKKILMLLLIFITTIFYGCSKQISYDAYDDLITDLENMDYTIEAEDVEENILIGKRKWLTVDGTENISVYLYESNAKMEKDASYLSDDGFSYNDGKKSINVDWISYPHFYKSENMIVLYVGDNLTLVNDLKEIVGDQFAGEIE